MFVRNNEILMKKINSYFFLIVYLFMVDKI